MLLSTVRSVTVTAKVKIFLTMLLHISARVPAKVIQENVTHRLPRKDGIIVLV